METPATNNNNNSVLQRSVAMRIIKQGAEAVSIYFYDLRFCRGRIGSSNSDFLMGAFLCCYSVCLRVPSWGRRWWWRSGSVRNIDILFWIPSSLSSAYMGWVRLLFLRFFPLPFTSRPQTLPSPGGHVGYTIRRILRFFHNFTTLSWRRNPMLARLNLFVDFLYAVRHIEIDSYTYKP